MDAELVLKQAMAMQRVAATHGWPVLGNKRRMGSLDSDRIVVKLRSRPAILATGVYQLN
jgi:hypothetical protein